MQQQKLMNVEIEGSFSNRYLLAANRYNQELQRVRTDINIVAPGYLKDKAKRIAKECSGNEILDPEKVIEIAKTLEIVDAI